MRKVLLTLALLLLTASVVEAGIITRPTKTFGGTTFINAVVADASDFNGDIDTAYSEINGSLSNVNISSSAAIAGSKITPAFTAETSVSVASVACLYLNESGQSANQRRWYECVHGGTWGITSRDDSGVIQATPIQINRSTAVVTFSQVPSIPGTSGGILGFTGSTTLASSAALTQRAMVIGGGAGATPATATAALTNGQLYIGRTGADPIAATLQGNGITITNADGSILLTAAPTAPAFGRVVITSGDITTTSTSLVDLTGATVTFTTGAFPVQVNFTAGVSNAVTNATYFNVDVDGANELGTSGIQSNITSLLATTIAHQTAALTAASHTIKIVWRVSGGTGTVTANSGSAASFSAHEIR